MKTPLEWPDEKVSQDQSGPVRWFHPASNYCLDFHGDPHRSELIVFSDGNHHMALGETLERFRKTNGLQSIFYCTTPPQVYLQLLRQGSIDIGNLRISVKPDLIIGPDNILAPLVKQRTIRRNQGFIQSMGNSLLVKKGNPKNIVKIADLFRKDIRFFISNPDTEKASFEVYRNSIANQAVSDGIDYSIIEKFFAQDNPNLVFGEMIHHREAPVAIAEDKADAAMVYHHLALRYTRIFPAGFSIVDLPFHQGNITTEYQFGVCIPEKKLALKLAEYLLSEQTKAIYEHHGLKRI